MTNNKQLGEVTMERATNAMRNTVEITLWLTEPAVIIEGRDLGPIAHLALHNML